MATSPLATVDDVRELFPASFNPGMSDEQIARLILKACALLRQRAPWIDRRIELFVDHADTDAGLDPLLVASVVATIVKRFLVNPSGATNEAETVGPYQRSTGFALRGDKDVRGELVVIDSDIEKLRRPRVLSPYFGSARLAVPLSPTRRTGEAFPIDSGIPGSGWITPPQG